MNNDFEKLQVALIRNDFDNFTKTACQLDINSKNNRAKMNILHFYATNPNLNYNSDDLFKFLVKEKGLKINDIDGVGYSPVYCCVIYKNIEGLESLIKHGADIELPDLKGTTPLLRAVINFKGEEKLLDIIFLLLKHGASMENKNKSKVSVKSFIAFMAESYEENLNPKEWDLRPHLGNS